MLIMTKRSHRKTDPFLLLVLFVAIGMCATLAYQVSVYSGGDRPPLAEESSGSSSQIGG